MTRAPRVRPANVRSSFRPQLEALEDRLPPANGVPSPAHVVIVMEENHSYSEIIGSPQAPYINSLAQQGASMTHSFAVEHPSLPCYLDFFSGSNQGITGDPCPAGPFSTPNLGSELIAGGLTFGGYSEDLPSVGDTVCFANGYKRGHNPWVDFSNVPSADNMPFAGYFPSDFNQLPTVSIVVPNLDHDMHDGTIQQGDQWLQNNLDAYVQWAKANNSLLIVTWDEDDGSQSNQVATLFVGPMVNAGQYGETVNHFNVLRTVEDMYNIGYAGQSASVTPINDIWVTAASPPAAPSNLTATARSSTRVDLAWTDNSGTSSINPPAASFNLYREATTDTRWSWFAATGPGVTGYTWSGGSAGVTYYFYATAAIGAVQSGPSNIPSTTMTGSTSPTAAPAAPGKLTLTVAGSSAINLSWTINDTDQNGFNLYRSTDGTNFTQIGTTGAGINLYTDQGLSGSTLYYYRVNAYNLIGTSDYSNTAMTATTPPAAPSALTASAALASEIDLAWNNDGTTTGLSIERATDDTIWTQIATADGSVTTYQDTGLTAATQYYYRVRASNAAGRSASSNDARATTPTQSVPAAPDNLTATARSSTDVDLAWTDNSETSFKLYWSTDQTNWTLFAEPQGVATYTWSGGSAGVTYYFYATASVSAGDSTPSNISSATTTGSSDPTVAPAAPNDLTLMVAGSSQINLSWTSNDYIQNGFNLYRSTDGTNFIQIASTGAGITSYADMGLSGSTTYYYEVNAYDSIGTSDNSNVATVSTAPLAAPSNLAAAATSATQINLSWTDNATATGSTRFKLYRSTDNVHFDWFATTGLGATSYTWYRASPSTTYYFQVTASDAAGDSAPSNTAGASTMAVPAAPSNLTAIVPGGVDIDLAWKDNSTSPTLATGFNLYWSTDLVNWTWFAAPRQTSGSRFYGRPPGTFYFYVTASGSAGESAPSNIASATTLGSRVRPPSPSNLTLMVAGSSQINLSWTNNATFPIYGFRILRSTDGANFTPIATTGDGITHYQDKGLSASTTYYYAVMAYDRDAGSSGYSNQPNATTSAAGTSLAPMAGASGVLAGVGQTVAWSRNLGEAATVGVYVANADGSLTAEEQARIQDAITAFNDETGGDGVSSGLYVTLVTDPAQANIIVENATTTMLGGRSDGVLGDAEMMYASSRSNQTDDGNPYLQFTGYVTVNVVEGWNWYTGADPGLIPSDQYDYQTVVTHELGHAVGLYHDTSTYPGFNDDNHSVMYPSLSPGLTRRNFSDYDYAWLQHLYAGATDPGSNGTPGQADAQVTGADLPGPDVAPPVPAAVDVPAAPRVLLLTAAADKQSRMPADRLSGPGGSLPATVGAASLPHLGALPLTVIAEGQGALAKQQLLSPALPSLTNEAGLRDNGGRGAGAELSLGSVTASPLVGSLLSSFSFPMPRQLSAYSDSGAGDQEATWSDDEPAGARAPAADPHGMPSAPTPATEEDGLTENHSPAWTAACTALFAGDGRTAFSEDANPVLPWSTPTEPVPAPDSAATAAALAVLVGNYWCFRPEATKTRRRDSE